MRRKVLQSTYSLTVVDVLRQSSLVVQNDGIVRLELKNFRKRKYAEAEVQKGGGDNVEDIRFQVPCERRVLVLGRATAV